MNTGLAAVIVGVAIVVIVAGIVIPVVRSRGRNVGWDSPAGASATADATDAAPLSVGPVQPGPGTGSPPA